MNMKVNLNKQLNGIELIFQEKPSTEILTMLKGNGFRWHRQKKLWYAKVTDERKAFVKELEKANTEIISVSNNVSETPTKAKAKKQPVNKYGVKVGDMFCDIWGYEQTNVDFFRVKALRGKTQVILQQVYLEMTQDKSVSGMSADRKYNSKNYSLVKNSWFVKDNENGIIKKVLGTKEEPYINMTSYANAYKYDGQELYESWYY